MAKRRFVDPFELLIRRADLPKLLTLFMRAEERLTLAFPRAARALAESQLPSARQVRGTTRRHYLQEALLSAAQDAGIPVETRWTDPPTWSFPVAKSGAFSITIGIVETRFRGAGKSLRTRSKYVKALCERNGIVDPQTSLFDTLKPSDAVVPDGSLGALIVAQYSAHQPEKPAFLGFWVPSQELNGTFYVRSFEEVITMLRDRLSLARRPAKRVVERKPLRKRKDKPEKKA